MLSILIQNQNEKLELVIMWNDQPYISLETLTLRPGREFALNAFPFCTLFLQNFPVFESPPSQPEKLLAKWPRIEAFAGENVLTLKG